MILRGNILAVKHFVTQFTHVLRHPRVKNRKQKKLTVENVENVVSDLCRQNFFFLKEFNN